MQHRSAARAALIAVVLALVGTLGVLLWRLVPLLDVHGNAASRGRSIHRGVTSSVALPDAYARAESRVNEWRRDAYLVRIEAAWYLTDGWANVDLPPVAWTFSYYSPGAACLAVVVIDDDQTLWVSPFEIPVTPTPLGATLPPQGPNVAWLSFRAAGGDVFLRAHPGSQVTFRLQQSNDQPTWRVSAFDNEAFTGISMDAQTGVVTTGPSNSD